MLVGLVLSLLTFQQPPENADIVSFQSGHHTLRGTLYKPDGPGPHPALLYNHGSAPGMLNNQAFEQLGPLFARRGWVFFAPYRRGQGLSATAGPYIGDEIAAARRRGTWLGLAVAVPCALVLFLLLGRKWKGWVRGMSGAALALLTLFAVQWTGGRTSAATMVRLLETDHLDDQLAALQWLHAQPFVDRRRIAVAGNSFGGIETVLGAERVKYCAAIDASGGAESWAAAPPLRSVMVRAARASQAPISFFQAENDYDLSPSRTLSAEMKDAGKIADVKIYPPFGKSPSEGHSFAWAGSAVWADDVFRFLDRHCARQGAGVPTTGTAR